jgi:hypothetical protein
MAFLVVQLGAGMADGLSITRSQPLDKARRDRIFVTNGKVHDLDQMEVVPLAPCPIGRPLL